MKFTVRHPIRVKIDEKKDCLYFIINNFPYIYHQWQDEEIRKAEAMAKEAEKEDNADFFMPSIEHVYYKAESLDTVFYPSLFIMTCSFFDSFVFLFAKETNTKKSKAKSNEAKKSLVQDICDKRQIDLSSKAKEALEWIDSDIRALRDDIVHNNEGTQKRAPIIAKLTKENEEIIYEEDSVSISGPNFILKLLDKEYLVLCELCEKLGYKSKHYST